jgi:hypothetical protein
VAFHFPIVVETAAVGKARRSRKGKTERVMIGPREKEERMARTRRRRKRQIVVCVS